MRTLTRNERRAIKLEIKKSKFSFEKLRIIIDCKEYEKKLWLLGLNIFDDKNGMSQRICVPFKTEPDMARIREQLESYPASVYLAPVMEADE
jgi:hypothetical protein